MQTSAADKLEKNHKTLMSIVDMFPDQRAKKVRQMFDGIVGEQFLTAPASSREAYHSCYPGGLVEHSISVVMHAIDLNKLWGSQYPVETVAFCALFHDLGKVGDGAEPFYVPTVHKWKRDKGELYDINPKCQYMCTAERGIFILQQNGIELSSDEYLGIRLSDGQYVRENEPYRMKEPKLAILVHFADLWCTINEKQ